jgi:hypothetical protein
MKIKKAQKRITARNAMVKRNLRANKIAKISKIMNEFNKILGVSK